MNLCDHCQTKLVPGVRMKALSPPEITFELCPACPIYASLEGAGMAIRVALARQGIHVGAAADALRQLMAPTANAASEVCLAAAWALGWARRADRHCAVVRVFFSTTTGEDECGVLDSLLGGFDWWEYLTRENLEAERGALGGKDGATIPFVYEQGRSPEFDSLVGRGDMEPPEVCIEKRAAFLAGK